MDEDPPLGTAQGLFHFIDGALAYAGPYLHNDDGPLHTHTHSFVEIAFIVSGAGTHNSLSGRRDVRAGDVILLRPGVWHGFDNCQDLNVIKGMAMPFADYVALPTAA